MAGGCAGGRLVLDCFLDFPARVSLLRRSMSQMTTHSNVRAMTNIPLTTPPMIAPLLLLGADSGLEGSDGTGAEEVLAVTLTMSVGSSTKNTWFV